MLILMKKIAIFHNLKPGGGLTILKKITAEFVRKGYSVDIYSHQNAYIKSSSRLYYFPIKNTHNSIEQVFQSIFELNNLQKKIAKQISNKKYDHIFVFPCNIIQSPHILKYLPKDKTYYFFLEPKREFYEKSSFDYYSPKRIISRLMRYPIKIIDLNNCQSIDNIISDSYYTRNNLIKIYKKKSLVIYPGMKQIIPKQISIQNNKKYMSLSILSMLKGHHISAELISSVEIFGNKSHENINKYLPKNIKINTQFKQTDKNQIYKQHTFFLANQIREPFGLTTLEAINNRCYVFGSNEAGTSEIIQNHINGILLPICEMKNTKKIIAAYSKNKTIFFQKKCIIDWKYTTEKILETIIYE